MMRKHRIPLILLSVCLFLAYSYRIALGADDYTMEYCATLTPPN